MRFANRIEKLPPYVFALQAKRIAEMRASGIQVINFGMGDPDIPTPDPLLDTMCEAVRDPRNSRYPDYFGKPALRRAIADWYGGRFGVDLDPDTEVLPLIGSKEGIANLAVALVDSSKAALVPDPSYPTYKFGTIMADGIIRTLPLSEENGWLPDLEAVEHHSTQPITVLWLNYPNNPTGAVADLEFFDRAVNWARRHDVIIAHDNPYSDLAFDGYMAPSILEVPGAKDVSVEFNSLSKTYSMAGWRIGMVVGNPEIIEVLGRIKTNIDSGIYGAIQDAAVAALTGDQSWIPERNKIYEERRNKLCAALELLGVSAPRPKASLYLWGRVPAGYTSKEFAEQLLAATGIVVTPGTSYGAQGEGYIRLSMTVSDAEVEDACRRFSTFKLKEKVAAGS